jgi:hypothetical protein
MSKSVSTTDPMAVPATGRVTPSPWAWMILACVLLGASGGVRAWQDYRFATVQDRVEAPPFPLKEVSRTLGDWQVQDGGETSLDPDIAKVAGCSDHVIRTYKNRLTGVSVTVLILFGPAEAVFGHRPEICYPSAGYRMVAEPTFREVASGAGPAAVFCSEVFVREGEKRLGREEVHYSFRHGDLWTPNVEQFWKNFRHNPSMYKIQVQRTVSEAEKREVNNPSEQFLAFLLPEIEQKIAQSHGGREG